jgi:hypothetical protein
LANVTISISVSQNQAMRFGIRAIRAQKADRVVDAIDEDDAGRKVKEERGQGLNSPDF